ncbi:MAG: bifunctional nuclease family protein [Saprospiraceae bacterium]|nr:bifunctional nuclease family protein [Saprospiraceae bacterium]
MKSDKVELAVTALSASESQPGNFALVLEDFNNQHRIPIIIGAQEAQAIAMAMEKMQPIRPMTHDLFKNALELLGASIREVLIYQLKDKVFCASILLKQANNEILNLEARASDAIALAVRAGAPIFILEHVIEEAGIMTTSLAGRPKKGSLAEYTLTELEELLQKVVEKEDYESAVRIRSYIEKRRQGGG